MIIDLLFALYIALLALATWLLWPRHPGPVGWCRWCGKLIYTPYANHYDHRKLLDDHYICCQPFNEHVSRTIVRAREVYRQRMRRRGIDISA